MLSSTRRLFAACVLMLASCRSPATPPHVLLGAEPSFTVSVQDLNVVVKVTTVDFACTRAYKTRTVLHSWNIDVWPYVVVPEDPCPAVIGTQTHLATVRVPTPGAYVVGVHGWSYDGVPHEVVLTRTVSVGG